MYVFPIEVCYSHDEMAINDKNSFDLQENAAIYSFTAQIDDRIITALLKEKKVAEKEYESAVQQGQTAVLMRQNEKTLDRFTVSLFYEYIYLDWIFIRSNHRTRLLYLDEYRCFTTWKRMSSKDPICD